MHILICYQSLVTLCPFLIRSVNVHLSSYYLAFPLHRLLFAGFLGTVLPYQNLILCSVLGTNARFCCKQFGWPTTEFFTQSVIHNNNFFNQYFSNHVSNVDLDTALLLLEMIFVKENTLSLPPDFFVNNESNDIINYVATY